MLELHEKCPIEHLQQFKNRTLKNAIGSVCIRSVLVLIFKSVLVPIFESFHGLSQALKMLTKNHEDECPYGCASCCYTLGKKLIRLGIGGILYRLVLTIKAVLVLPWMLGFRHLKNIDESSIFGSLSLSSSLLVPLFGKFLSLALG